MSATTFTKKIAVIAGAGPGTGAAIARRFAGHYPVVLLARTPASLDTLVRDIKNQNGTALALPTDVTDMSSMNQAMVETKVRLGSNIHIAAAVFNVASKFTRHAFLESTPADYLGSLQATANGAYNFSKAVLPLMLDSDSNESSYPPTLIFTGATAALKGGNGLGSFAMSKFAIRAMAQSLAREFGPRGIHVAHAVVDGIIDTEKTKGFLDEVPGSKISPDQVSCSQTVLFHSLIANAYWYLHTQSKTSFTHELDLRPYCENW